MLLNIAISKINQIINILKENVHERIVFKRENNSINLVRRAEQLLHYIIKQFEVFEQFYVTFCNPH